MDDVEGSKRKVFLNMVHLVNLAMAEIKGPELSARSCDCAGGLKRVSINFDATKLPFDVNFGAPQHGVLCTGSKFLSVERAEHDALIKVAGYLRSNFAAHIIDLSYENLCISEKNCLEVVNSIEESVGIIKSMVGHWKTCVGLLEKEHRSFSGNSNALYIAIAGRLADVKSLGEASLETISDQMLVISNEYAHFSKDSLLTTKEVAITIKIPETDIIRDILLSLGLKAPKFSNTLVDNALFRGKCKIMVNVSSTSKTSGKISIEGDVKESAYEAECSAGAKAICYLERVMGLEIVDLNFHALLEKNAELKFLKSVKAKFVDLEHRAAAEWSSFINEVNLIVNDEYANCKDLGLDVDEYDKAECIQMLEDSIWYITSLFYLGSN